MMKFLLRRPIAVCMTFVALCVLGIATYSSLPVTLLPSIPIPEITVQTVGNNKSAREMENSVITPLRKELLQVKGLKDIHSESRDGIGFIHLKFVFGTDINLSFIEVNEKIDQITSMLPAGVERPQAVKSSATDIPVMSINMTLKGDHAFCPTNEQKFVELCDAAQEVVRRRIEQLPEVAMTDISGIPGKNVILRPDVEKMRIVGLTVDDLSSVIQANNIEPGVMVVRDGYYEYNIHLGNVLRTENDVKTIPLTHEGRLYHLSDFCNISLAPVNEKGLQLSQGKQAVSLAVIKRGEGNMDQLRAQIDQTLDNFREQYPEIDFKVTRNQTELLDYTISSLQQNFVLGFLLMFIAAVFFMGNLRTPVVTGISMAVALILTFLAFFIFKRTLNIISLSGMILVVGMMIDNAIIVTENISQHELRGENLLSACARGTSEMITPMLSSSLTTVAVFVPLIFLSDIAGALFSDQAFSITIGLTSSYIVSVFLLPILYLLVSRLLKNMRKKDEDWRISTFINTHIISSYEHGIDFVFSHSRCFVAIVLMSIPLCFINFNLLKKEQMPRTHHTDMLARVDWNDNIHIDENRQRVNELSQQIRPQEFSAAVGAQNYLLSSNAELTPTEAELYVKTSAPDSIDLLKDKIRKFINGHYPHAIVSFSFSDNIFDRLFSSQEAPIVAKINRESDIAEPSEDELLHIRRSLMNATGLSTAPIAMQEQMVLDVDMKKVELYGVSTNEIINVFSLAFNNTNVGQLHSSQCYLPINVGEEKPTVGDFLKSAMVHGGSKETLIPLSEFVHVRPTCGVKSIVAGKDGEYFPFSFYHVDNGGKVARQVTDEFKGSRHQGWKALVEGSWFDNQKLMRNLMMILLVSMLLMYFILCAQFESFLQPLIVLAEIPIDISFTLFVLWIAGDTLNLMSGIGIIASCGIVINDSILKLDAINVLRKKGLPMIEAVHTAGKSRLRAIIMTSLTTVLAMLPFFFTNDLGNELQRPLAIAMIAALSLGTVVSIFIIPMIYSLIYTKKEKQEKHRIA